MRHFFSKYGWPSSSFNGRTDANQSAHRMDTSKRAQIRLNLGSRLRANARSADRAFAPNVTNNTSCFPFSFLFVKRMTPIIRASGFSNTTTLQRRLTTTTVGRRSCHTHENCMHAEQIIIIFSIFFHFLLSVFVIVFNCIIQNNSYCLHWRYFSI